MLRYLDIRRSINVYPCYFDNNGIITNNILIHIVCIIIDLKKWKIKILTLTNSTLHIKLNFDPRFKSLERSFLLPILTSAFPASEGMFKVNIALYTKRIIEMAIRCDCAYILYKIKKLYYDILIKVTFKFHHEFDCAPLWYFSRLFYLYFSFVHSNMFRLKLCDDESIKLRLSIRFWVENFTILSPRYNCIFLKSFLQFSL